MRTKSTLLIILMVFLSHNHSTLGKSIIPHWHWTFARVSTLYNCMCNSIFTPIKTRLARIGGIFSAILYRKQSAVNMEEIEPIEAEPTTSNVPKQSEYEYFQNVKEKMNKLLSSIDEQTNKAQRTSTISTLLGFGSLAAFNGLGKTPVPQLMAHYTRFKLASILPFLNVAYPFALPAVTLFIGGFTAWKARRAMNNQQEGFKTKLDIFTASLNDELARLESKFYLSQDHPHCTYNINDLNAKLNMKFEDLAQRLVNISERTQSALTNLERLKDHNYTEESEKKIFNSTKKELTTICTLMASAKEEDEKTSKDIEDFFPGLKRLKQKTVEKALSTIEPHTA